MRFWEWLRPAADARTFGAFDTYEEYVRAIQSCEFSQFDGQELDDSPIQRTADTQTAKEH